MEVERTCSPAFGVPVLLHRGTVAVGAGQTVNDRLARTLLPGKWRLHEVTCRSVLWMNGAGCYRVECSSTIARQPEDSPCLVICCGDADPAGRIAARTLERDLWAQGLGREMTVRRRLAHGETAAGLAACLSCCADLISCGMLPISLRGYSTKTTCLSRRASEIDQTGRSGQSPRTCLMTESLAAFASASSGTREL